ncbi:LysR family transcriptional regulator, nitrogen assimilation regulatory protein [Variovorax sp. HW608]|uniref:LysR family transcriptional regulator n=1 Tax=Variovorax sp. HW608 TaxID=1034889 RepID=UPI00081F7BD7|nr:LysR family transcriptional regulator [Variovorax sp. HW608]SCK35176.1 LysR family transcriptional regulator, nitrogen assimilation regulatory protein [Variovorax sp. HW608]
MHITLRQLKYFVEIARSRSFSRAAQQLGIAQPALSQNIAALEDELGAKLFERHAKGVDLSPEGQRLYERAVELISGFDALRGDVHGHDVLPVGPVRLMVAGSVAGVVIAPLLAAVATRYPGIRLTVSDGLSSEVRLQVEAGHAQLALMPSPSELQGMDAMPVFEERFMVFGAAKLMRREPAEIAFAQIAQRPLAAPDRAHDLRKIIERAALAIDRPLDVRYELNSPPMLVAVVKEGLAYAILPPSSCIEAVAAKSIVGRPIAGTELSRVQAIVWPQQRPLSPASMAVRDLLAEVVREQLEAGLLYGRLIERP